MKERWKCPIAAALVLCLIVGILWPAINVHAGVDDFAAELKVGYNNKAEMGRYAPFMVTIENKSSDFNGRLQVIVGNKVSYNLMYETDFSIGRGETKTVNFACKVADNLGKANIRLVTKKEKVVWSEEKRFSVDKTALQNIDIGVLSDDFSALGYMDNLQFYDRETFKTNLMELTADTFPEDVNALDMLEIIVISNFSTDILTDEQIEALSLWVSRGGFLIIGTGSNSSKTLSKLNGRVVDVQLDKMNRYQTAFGLNYYGEKVNNYTTQYQQQALDPEDDDEFLEAFDEIYYNYRDEVDAECLEDYMANNYLTEDDLEDDGSLPYYYEDDFYLYCSQYYFDTYWNTQYQPGPTEVYAYNTELVDVLEFKDDRGYETIKADSGSGDFELGRIYRAADGHVALYGIDFTMNPLPKYQDAGDIIKYIIYQYVLAEVVSRYDSASGYNYNYNLGTTSYNSNYRTKQFIENLASAPLPPLIFYVIPLVGYMLAVMIVYLVNKKKKKTFRLWYWYPILAIGVAVITFSIGFSTRIIRPRLNAATVVELNNPSTVEKNYVAVITPSNKTCEVGFSDDYDIQLIREINGYYDNSDKVDLNTYRVAFRKEIDQTYVRFKGNVALSSDQFELESIYPDTRTFEAQYVTNVPATTILPERVIITNKTGIDLENAVVIAADSSSSQYSGSYVSTKVYAIGDWKAGNTVDMTAQTWSTGINYSSSDEIAFGDEDKHILSGFFLGSLSEGFRTYTSRKNVLSYMKYTLEQELQNLSNTANEDPADLIYVAGFPKESTGKNIQANDKYRVERSEIIIQRINLRDMPQVVKK